MKKFTIILTLITLTPLFLDASIIKALTVNGNYVDLNENKTWSYSYNYKKPTDAKQKIATKRQNFSLWINPKIWKQVQSKEDDHLEFDHISGKAFAMILTDTFNLPHDILKDVTIQEIQQAFSNIKILTDEDRIVNGRPVGCLEITASNAGEPYQFFTYYFTHKKKGTIQVVTFSTSRDFYEHSTDLQNFANGLVIK